jgi:hypothetical protein
MQKDIHYQFISPIYTFGYLLMLYENRLSYCKNIHHHFVSEWNLLNYRYNYLLTICISMFAFSRILHHLSSNPLYKFLFYNDQASHLQIKNTRKNKCEIPGVKWGWTCLRVLKIYMVEHERWITCERRRSSLTCEKNKKIKLEQQLSNRHLQLAIQRHETLASSTAS